MRRSFQYLSFVSLLFCIVMHAAQSELSVGAVQQQESKPFDMLDWSKKIADDQIEPLYTQFQIPPFVRHVHALDHMPSLQSAQRAVDYFIKQKRLLDVVDLLETKDCPEGASLLATIVGAYGAIASKEDIRSLHALCDKALASKDPAVRDGMYMIKQIQVPVHKDMRPRKEVVPHKPKVVQRGDLVGYAWQHLCDADTIWHGNSQEKNMQVVKENYQKVLGCCQTKLQLKALVNLADIAAQEGNYDALQRYLQDGHMLADAIAIQKNIWNRACACHDISQADYFSIRAYQQCLIQAQQRYAYNHHNQER